jgi:ferredoxin
MMWLCARGGPYGARLKALKVRVAAMQEQARQLHERAGRLSPTGQRERYAVVERSRCTGCGLCEQLCPLDAIRVTYVAVVDAQRCNGCGLCVQNCPQGAMHVARSRPTPAPERGNA